MNSCQATRPIISADKSWTHVDILLSNDPKGYKLFYQHSFNSNFTNFQYSLILKYLNLSMGKDEW
jgi:hypothetical protein